MALPGAVRRARGTNPVFICFGGPLALQLLGTGRTVGLRSRSTLRVICGCLVTCSPLEVHFTIHWAAWSCGQPSSSKSSWATLGKLLPPSLPCSLYCETPSVCLLVFKWESFSKNILLQLSRKELNSFWNICAQTLLKGGTNCGQHCVGVTLLVGH